MNQGLMIARSIDWNAVTKVRSSVAFRPGMIVWAYRAKAPVIRPMVIVAATSEMPRNASSIIFLQLSASCRQ